ncbi:hypothetical protein [Psychrobacter sp. FDAARGOS_221]|uniref:hypothetical protein n=1 Tax=Psychrobacter sp. FDAARGOS_221 TaxID=1975705 RepID=UPI000BB57ABC|nr:hypothetical protein [Psychrobacter sp. FDAARGOS_221]PNK59573.1 hypothetical protein A6J60_000850 [Psychrobacter sp. FDAARGOS_221]
MSQSEQSESNQSLVVDSIDNNTDLNEYPTVKLIKTFALYGGFVGGLIMWFGFTVISPSNILNMFVFIILNSIVAGLIPSIVTAFILNRLRLILNQPIKWFYLLSVGAIVTALYAHIILSVLSMFRGGSFNLLIDYSQDTLLLIMLVSIIGGVSSLILGSLVLPKKTLLN